jgi:hypothetical protein
VYSCSRAGRFLEMRKPKGTICNIWIKKRNGNARGCRYSAAT